MRSANDGRHRCAQYGEDQQRAEQRKMPLRRQAGIDRADRAGAEDQRRNRQRHDQQDQQHAGAAQAERQRGAQAAEQRQDRRAEQQRGDQRGERLAAHAEQQADQRRHQHQRRAGHRPVRGGLGGGDEAAGLARQQHLFERAVGMVGGVEAGHRQHRRQQRADPDDAGGDLAQHLRLGADADREQADRDDEEHHRQQRFDAAAQRHAHVAAVDGEDGVGHLSGARPFRGARAPLGGQRTQ